VPKWGAAGRSEINTEERPETPQTTKRGNWKQKKETRKKSGKLKDWQGEDYRNIFYRIKYLIRKAENRGGYRIEYR
jgi:hypothetical protein